MTRESIVGRALSVVLPVAAALLVVALLVWEQGPIEVFTTTWEGAFRDSKSLAGVLNYWLPLVLAGLGLIVSFRAGLWNIGIEGQMMLGAITASWAALYLNLPEPLHVVVCVLMGILGGVGWAMLVGLLKTRLGVNEIFGGVALNSIASTLAIYLISGPWQPPEGGSAQATPLFPQAAWFPVASPEFPVPTLMIALVVLAFVALVLMLRVSRFGLQLKAVGRNPRSALLLGVPVTRTAIIALILCGALAGLAGSHRVLHTYHSLRPQVSGGIGFLALLAVLLSGFRLGWVPVLTFALAALNAGSTRLNVLMRLDPSLIGVLQGLIVLLILIGAGVHQRLTGREAAR